MRSLLRKVKNRLCMTVSSRGRRYADVADGYIFQTRFAKLGLNGIDNIPTWTTKRQLRMLFQLACDCPEGANVLEIGSYLGASTAYLVASMARKRGCVFCVDTWHNETMPDGARDTYTEFLNNLAGASEFIVPIRSKSSDLQLSDLRLPIHLAFIDADHSYEAVKADAKTVLPLMAADGIVAFHDSVAFFGVSKVIAELLLEGEWQLAGHLENLTWIKRAEWSPEPSNGSSNPG